MRDAKGVDGQLRLERFISNLLLLPGCSYNTFVTWNVGVCRHGQRTEMKLRQRRSKWKLYSSRKPVQDYIRNLNMFTMKPKTFHDAVKPLVYFNCFAGMGAFRQPNQTGATYFMMRLYTVIITVIQWATTYITLSYIEEVINFDNVSPMALMMYKTLVFTNSCIIVIAPLMVWLRRKVMMDCVRQMLILDETFQAVLGARNEYRKDYIRLTSRVVAISLLMFLVGIYDTVLGLGMKLQMSMESVLKFFSATYTLHHPILVMLLLDMNFCSFLGYLGKKFRDINESLLGLAEKPSSTSCPGERLFVISQNVGKTTSGKTVENPEAESLIKEKHHFLQEIRQVHLELCKLSRRINIAFGIQNLISMGISFVMITGLLFTIYSAVAWENITIIEITEVIPSAVWVAIYVFRIWSVNHSCWSVSNEAARTGEIIYEFLNSRIDEELGSEIQQFGIQMLQNPVRFNASGFFTLDYTFVQGAIGSITTYLVILIQLSNVPASSTSKTAAVTITRETEISANL